MLARKGAVFDFEVWSIAVLERLDGADDEIGEFGLG
jgi:hypothetical protein